MRACPSGPDSCSPNPNANRINAHITATATSAVFENQSAASVPAACLGCSLIRAWFPERSVCQPKELSPRAQALPDYRRRFQGVRSLGDRQAKLPRESPGRVSGAGSASARISFCPAIISHNYLPWASLGDAKEQTGACTVRAALCGAARLDVWAFVPVHQSL